MLCPAVIRGFVGDGRGCLLFGVGVCCCSFVAVVVSRVGYRCSILFRRWCSLLVVESGCLLLCAVCC